MGNGYYEHFTAYFITASLLTIAYSRPMQLLANCAMLTIGAGVLEVVQLAIPGRTASIADFAVGIIGAGIGVVVTSLITRIHGAIAVRPNT
jgi:VanZ family protein